MLYHLFTALTDKFEPFNLFRYLTFRTAGAIVTSLIISFIFGRPIINWLRSVQREGQPIRSDGPESHLLTKKGTPTMGGFMILAGLTVATLLWANLADIYVWVVLGVTLGYGALGFMDDYAKVTKQTSAGLTSIQKLIFQFLIAVTSGGGIIVF